MSAPEYAFVASERARGRARRAVAALAALGYDARHYAAGSAQAAEARHARTAVYCDAPPETARYVCDLAALPPDEGARQAYAVTAADPALAERAAAALGREVEVVPEPLEGARQAPRAARARPRSRPLEWLAQRAGLATDSWRTKLLWRAEEAQLDAIASAYPRLQQLGRGLPLALHCVAPPAVLEALLERVQEDAPEALQLSIEAASPQAVFLALESCDFVLVLPADARLEREALHAGRLAISDPDPCEAIRRALAEPRETLARLEHAQQELDRTCAAALVAQAWARILMKGTR